METHPPDLPVCQGELAASQERFPIPHWTAAVPVFALVTLALTWGRDLGAALVTAVAVVLAAAVLAAVQHAEVVAHRVGEPSGLCCWRSR